MNYNDLANLLYPNIIKTIDDLEKMYTERSLPNGAEVTRFAPSPTGRMHLGNLYASFIPEVIAKQTNGIFIVRIEDTDQKRKIENGIELGINDLEHYNYIVDDHFMRVTIVTRDDSYIASVPYHLELWDACGFSVPKFAHILPLNIKDGNSIRKISKRKDPEAAAIYYHEKGIPVEAIKLYFANIMNSNFDGWYLQNPDKSYRNFEFSFSKMSKSGPLFDLEKIINISKNYISRLSANEIYDKLLEWSLEYDNELYDLITKYKDYTIDILNIERIQKKPRKDFSCYSEIKSFIWYMYKELFVNPVYDWQNIKDIEEIKMILSDYINNYYDINDDKDTWFNKMKDITDKYGYCSDMKVYKENECNYKGSIIDISMIIRVGITSKSMTPDLYEIMRLLGKNEMKERINSL